ncbi:MAG: RNA polymerase sigma factor [Vicinamibacterales bacterium]
MNDVFPRHGSASDHELLVRAATGDRDAFAELFDRHHTAVHRFIRQMGGTADVADDVTQEVFVSLWRKPSHFDPGLASLTTYLYGVARNLLRRRLRFVSLRPQVDRAAVDEHRERLFSVPADIARELDQREQLAELRRAILALPFRHREVIVLCDLHELSYGEAATVVGCPVGTIRSRLNRARCALIARCRARLAPAGSAPRLTGRRGTMRVDAV